MSRLHHDTQFENPFFINFGVSLVAVLNRNICSDFVAFERNIFSEKNCGVAAFIFFCFTAYLVKFIDKVFNY